MSRRPHRPPPHRSDSGHDSDARQRRLVEADPGRAGRPRPVGTASADRSCRQGGRCSARAGSAGADAEDLAGPAA